jgi:hypothetical protein
MRTFTFFGILAALCCSAQLASAQYYRDTTGDTINAEKAINQSRTNAHIQLGQENFGALRSYRAGSYIPGSPANANVQVRPNQGQAAGAGAQAGQQNRGEQWRYRRFNGQWWYYLPTNRWTVWNGSRWTEPMAQAGSTRNQIGNRPQ